MCSILPLEVGLRVAPGVGRYGQFSSFEFDKTQIEGLKSQNHCLSSLQKAPCNQGPPASRAPRRAFHPDQQKLLQVKQQTMPAHYIYIYTCIYIYIYMYSCICMYECYTHHLCTPTRMHRRHGLAQGRLIVLEAEVSMSSRAQERCSKH